MSKYIGLIILIIFLIGGIIFFRFNPFSSTQTKNQNHTVSIDNHVFAVTIAQTDDEKHIGLSKRTSLPDNEGMLFPFQKPDYYQFWMKNMQFPLDIIYIHNNKIVTIVNDLPAPKGTANNNPPRFVPVEPAETVLEINAGLSKKYNFKVGDSVTISL